jgi:excisionase family DNA binding protein
MKNLDLAQIEKEYMTPTEAAHMLGVSRQSVDYAMRTGKMRSQTVLGKVFRLRTDVESYQPAGYLDRRPSKSNRKKTETGGTE